MVIIDKSDLFGGKNKIEKVKLESADKEVFLRPLTRAEVSVCEAIENKALGDYTTNEQTNRKGRRQKPKSHVTTEGKVNIEKVTKANFESECKMIHYSWDNEENTKRGLTLTEEEIGKMHPPIFAELITHIKRISGLDITEDDVKDFPEDE